MRKAAGGVVPTFDKGLNKLEADDDVMINKKIGNLELGLKELRVLTKGAIKTDKVMAKEKKKRETQT